MLQKVRPEWTADTFETVPFVTHGDEQMEGTLRDLGQGAFTGGSPSSKAELSRQQALTVVIMSCTTHPAVHPAAQCLNENISLIVLAEVIDRAVAEGSIDIGVHSLKDTPVKLPEGVQLAACLPRDDPR
jgi:porphobilinogen deaminase